MTLLVRLPGRNWGWILLLLWSWGAAATTFMPMPFPSRVEEAEGIVRAVVGESYTEWSAGRDGSRRIYTFTELTPREVIKEPASRPLPSGSFRVRELGGVKDGVGMQVSGTAKLTRGEEVVLMLGRLNDDGSYDIRGMMMGKFNLERDESGTEVLVGPGLDGAEDAEGHAFHSHPEGVRGQSGTSTREKWTLSRLKKLVQEQGAPGQKAADLSKNVSPSALAVPSGGSELGAPQLHSSEEAPGQKGSPQESGSEIGGSGERTGLWGLGLTVALGALGLWWVWRARRG